MRVLIKRAENIDLEVAVIGSNLESLQKAVGGYIECPSIPGLDENGISMTVNEEGKFAEGCEPNFALVDGKKVVDIIMGTAVFSGFDAENGKMIGITRKQMDIVRGMFDKKRGLDLGGDVLPVMNLTNNTSDDNI